MQTQAVLCAVLLSGAWLGCVRPATSVAEPTALERQLIGAYEELDQDLVYISSFRGRAKPAPTYESLRAEALQARALQVFNEDDVRTLKSAQCLGEDRNGFLRALSCEDTTADPVLLRALPRVVKEENQSRQKILDWALVELARSKGRALPSREERRQVEEAHRELRVLAARPTDLLETSSGVFAPKGEAKRSSP